MNLSQTIVQTFDDANNIVQITPAGRNENGVRMLRVKVVEGGVVAEAEVIAGSLLGVVQQIIEGE